MRASGLRVGDTVLLDGVHLMVTRVTRPVHSGVVSVYVHGETYPRSIPEQAEVTVLRAERVRGGDAS